MKNKYLLFLLTLFIVWLFSASYLFYGLQKQSTSIEIFHLKIGSSEIPFIFNKKTNAMYKFFTNDTDTGFTQIPVYEIDKRRKNNVTKCL